jgi:hypothetical protein
MTEEIMGYFDALTNGSFKTAKDGRRLFFPWGVMGRGYLIPTEQDYERLRRKVKIYLVLSMFLILLVGFAFKFMVSISIVLLSLIIIPYVLWAHAQCRGLVPVEEKYMISESVASQAREHGTLSLWILEIFSVAFVAGGIFIFVADPKQWPVAILSVAFFGLGAFVFARMIILRRRQKSQSRH